MIKTFFYHFDYFVLALILLAGVTSFFYFSAQSLKGIVVVCILVSSYFLWGIGHHAFKKDLHFKVVLEYLLISLLGLAAFLSLIKRL